MSEPGRCEYCHDMREDVKLRRIPYTDRGAWLCQDCWLDVQARWTKERQEP